MAPQLPVRSVGRQGLKASVQGLGDIEKLFGPCKKCAALLCTIATGPFRFRLHGNVHGL